MLLVETYIGSSKIHGIGVFVAKFISKDTPIWKFADGFDLQVAKEKLETLAEPAKKQFLHYSYFDPKTNMYTLAFDDERFANHSDHPNIITVVDAQGEEIDVAARAIQKGEELTWDYNILEEIKDDSLKW